MKTIQTKKAKNWATMYYVDGKRVSKLVAEKTALENFENAVANINGEHITADFAGAAIVQFNFTSAVFDSICFAKTFDTAEHAINAARKAKDIEGFFSSMVISDATNDNAILAKFYCDKVISEKYFKELIPTQAVDASEYAVSDEAFAIAVDAEIALANGTGTFDQVKALCNEMFSFNFGSYRNAEVYGTCHLIIAMIDALQNNELDGFYWAGYEFQSEYESAWACTMSIIGEDCQYKGVDEKAQLSAVWTHDLNSCSFNRRGLAHFINNVITTSEVARHFAHFCRETGRNINDYIIPFYNNTVENTGTGNEPAENEVDINDTYPLQEVEASDYAISDYRLNELNLALANNSIEEKTTMTTETKNEVATDIENFLVAKQEITYDTNAAGAKIWKQNRAKITKDNAAKILANYGLTIDAYLAAQKAWIYREVSKACAQMLIDDQADFYLKKVFAECKPLDDENVWELIPELDDLNDVDTATAETESASKTAEPAPADDFAAKLADLKAAADNAKCALAKAQADCNKASAELKNFIDEQAYYLNQKLDDLSLAYTITLKKENGANYRVKNFDDIYIGAYRPGFDIEFHFEFWNGKTIARYETPAQVEAVIARLKAAIARGDEQFTFPTIDDLKPPTFKPDAEWTGISGDHFYRIGEEYLVFDKAGRFVEVFNRELGGYYTRKGEFYYKNKSDNPDAIWEGNRHKCDEKLFFRIMALRADDSLEESPDAVQVANDYQQILDTVKAQIAADNFDYVAAKEHIENVYEDIRNCIEHWSHAHGLTQEQSEKIYVTLYAAPRSKSYFDDVKRKLRDKMIVEFKTANSLTRAMEIALKKFQGFCKIGNLTAANREMACYQICRNAFKDVI